MKVSSKIATLALLLTVSVLAAAAWSRKRRPRDRRRLTRRRNRPGRTFADARAECAAGNAANFATVAAGSSRAADAVSLARRSDFAGEPREPNFPVQQAQPVMPMPDLSRVGIISSNILSLSLTDAIRKALQNNNEIEIARDDVRFAETQLRGLYGVYDPLFSITPQIIHNITPQQSSLGGGGAAGTTTTTIFNFSPSLTKYFERGGGNYTAELREFAADDK